MRVVALDTETTGLNPHVDEIVEVGAVEIIDRRIGKSFHSFVRPTIQVQPGAQHVHGLTDEFLFDKPAFSEVREPLREFLVGADEILIHNAPFDTHFLDRQLGEFSSKFNVTCTLAMSRALGVTKRHGLSALVSHYEIVDLRAQEGRHGAEIDARLLAQVWLHMTTGQRVMELEAPPPSGPRPLALAERRQTIVFIATEEERRLHDEFCRLHNIPVF